MANGKNIENRKKNLETITKNIDDKKVRLGELETTKESVREARQFIDNLTDLDDDVKSELERENNASYDAISKEGKEISSEMNDDINQLENLRNETDSALESAKEAKTAEKNLVDACRENNIIVPENSDLRENIRNNESLLQEIIQKQQDAEKIASKLGML